MNAKPLSMKLVSLVVAALAAMGALVVVSVWKANDQLSATTTDLAQKKSAHKPAVTVEPDRFHDVASQSGVDFNMTFLAGEQGENFKINLYDHGCGVVIGDYDGDGHDDIYFLNQLGSNALYRNLGNGSFEDVTFFAGVGLADRICVAATFADYDNDGFQDLYVTSTRGGNVLFHNEGNGSFRDVTKEAGVDCVAHSQTACFVDYDADGSLDLLVTNTAEWTLKSYDARNRYYFGRNDLWELAESRREENLFFRNRGNGTFEEVAAKIGLAGKGWSGDVAVLDYDEDGRVDLLITNMFGSSQLYRQNPDHTFTDMTSSVLGKISWGAIGSKALDINNDGRLDLCVVDMHSDMWLPMTVDPDPHGDLAPYLKKYPTVLGRRYENVESSALKQEEEFRDRFRIKYDEVLFGNTLFKATGNGTFEEISDKAGFETYWPWGIATGDFDNDGYLDVYLPSGMGHPWAYWPSVLLMNRGDETFVNRAAELGVEPPRGGELLDENIGAEPAAKSSRCAAAGDFDSDGRVDLIVNNFNGPAYYYRNDLPKQNYVKFRLRGTRSNRDAVGSLVRVYRGSETQVRQVDPAGGYLSQSSQTAHFGLGDSDAIDYVEVTWASGTRQRVDRVAVNTLIELVEPADAQGEPETSPSKPKDPSAKEAP